MRITAACTPLLLVALGLAGNVLPGSAQDSGSFYPPLTLAPAEATASSGGAGLDEKATAAELAKKLANPIAALISFPIQNDFDWGAGSNGDGFKYKVNIQPVIVPINLRVAQLVKIGKLPVQFEVGGRYYAEHAINGPEWGLRLAVTSLFPKSPDLKV